MDSKGTCACVTHKGTQTLETARLILRRARLEDARPMFENWASDPEVTKFLTWPPHKNVGITETILRLWIQEYEKPDCYQWIIELKEIREPIGTISVVSQDDQVGKAEIGYCIGKAWWHRGIASEALQAVIQFLLGEVGMKRIEAGHDPNNPHSGGVMKKCGMKYEGTFRSACRSNQGICDKAVYSLLRKDLEQPKSFMDGYSVADETELVQEIYRRFDEDTRLNRSQAARVEFLTTVKYIEKYLPRDGKILDVGAGAGEYSLYFARKGYQVSALELADANIAAFRRKITPSDTIDLVRGNALDLSRYADHSFDVVLLLGPLYHLREEADKLRCIGEARRVCKPGGKLFLGFISNDIVILTMQQCQADYLLEGAYDKETFRLEDFPFVFHTVDRCRELLKKANLSVCHQVASDGVSELLQNLINGLDEKSYAQYLRYHEYICEKPEHLGMSSHLLFVCQA